MSHQALNTEQFTGFVHPRHLIPTENTWENERGPAAAKYQADLTAHVAEHGMNPIETYYSERGQYGTGRRQRPKLYVTQGHHRLKAAKTLGLGRVPVTVRSDGRSRPPELEDDE
jgi:hypothetical protein